MASQVPLTEDPLVAALPPETDYITYLTLLEYQLTPQNLSTLNRLLSEDDGTLAAEIGWDLVRLVLPMLKDAPDNAKNCLDIIARRGNPREVVVRVAEELEKLGYNDNDEDDLESKDGTENTPAFSGEAPHIHLGQMTLEGMPPAAESSKAPQPPDGRSKAVEAELEGLKLLSLLSMMSTLHPRIRTQYPSRFLATSLPAALRAYRTLDITPATTSAFIAFLSKSSGKQRPPLPPRTSTAGSNAALSDPGATSPLEATTTHVSLPDPESGKDSTEASKKPSENEKAIVQRLLQAVLLEVVDEYTATFASTDVSSMQWTSRLRAKYEAHSLPTYRTEELSLWSTDAKLTERASTVTKLIKVGGDLGLDVVNEIKILGDTKRRQSANDAEEEAAPEASEYPSSPAEIPFSTTGLVLLFAAQTFATNSKAQPATLSKEPLVIDPVYLFSHLRTSNPAPSSSATDAALSLLYLESLRPSTSDQTVLIHTLKLLQDTFITSADPTIRDNAHHIATTLLHCRCDRPSRIAFINSILAVPRKQSSTEGPRHDVQFGSTKSIAVEWLKDEIYPSELAWRTMKRITDEVPRGTPASIFVDDKSLASNVFPASLIPGPPASGEPEPDALEAFLLNVPFYISSLNLLSILARQEHGNTSLKAVLERGETTLALLEKWKDVLVNMATLAADRAGEGNDAGDMNVADIYALEDAVGRAREAFDEP